MTQQPIRLDHLQTERRSPRTADIDELSTLEILAKINQEDAHIHLAIADNLVAIAALVDAIFALLTGQVHNTLAIHNGHLKNALGASQCNTLNKTSVE